MKRKRGCNGHNPKRLEAVGANKTLLNSVSLNSEDHSGVGDSRNGSFDSRMDVETTEADSVRVEKINADNPMHGRNLQKNVASLAAKLSKDVGSSSADVLTKNLSLYNGKEPKFSRQDTQYNKKELHAALSVIKRIMKMDEAKPFGSPVDPVALRLPDYFDVIDTPMDFGTICNMIELGTKYMNSKDVYKDVELIWSNSCKYHKNGSYNLELMKQVKNNFMKHWNAAGLFREQEEANNVQLESNAPQATEYGMPHSKHGRFCSAGSLISNSLFLEQPDSTGPCQMQQKHHLPCCGHVNQPKKVFSQCQCRWNYRELQSSQPQNGIPTAADGHFHSPVHGLFSFSTCNNCEHDCTLGPMTGNNNHQGQYQMCADHIHGYQELMCGEQYRPQQKSHQCHSTFSKCRGTEPDVTHTWNAGHSHVHSPLESSMKFTKRKLEYSLASLASNDSHQQHYQMDPGQLKSSSMIHGHSYQPQQQCQCHLDLVPQDPLLPLDRGNIGVGGHSYMPHPTESAVGHATCRVEFSAAPDIDDGSHEQECQKDQGESESPSLDHSPSHEPHPTESAVRHATCRVESSAVPITDDGSHEQECQKDTGESESPSLDQSPSHDPKGNGHLSQPSSSPPQEPSPAQAEGSRCNGDSTGLVRKTRGRGPTRCLSLLREGKRISITTNEVGEPVGLEAPKFISYLGTLARDGHMAPLTYVDWRALPEANKEKMWEEVQAKFEIDPSSKTWVLRSLSKKWKDWKAKLKTAHYITHATDEERLADRDERVLPDQWAYLVSHWSSEEAEKRSATNRANRAQQKFGHVTGTKSFARIREEERVKRPDGKVPTRTELFILTRTRKDGRPVNEASSAVITQLRDIVSQQKDTSKSTTATDDLFSQVVGRDKRGRLRCCALDPPASELGGTKPTHAEAIKMASEANAEVREMKERLVAVEQTCAQIAAQMATMMSMMSSMHKSLPVENIPNQVPTNSGTSEDLPSQQANSPPLRRSSQRGKAQVV